MGIASLVIGVVGIAAQQNQAKKLAAAQRESNSVSLATGNIKDRAARRRLAREERIRRARLLSASREAGGGRGSGEFGALAAFQTNFGAAVAEQTSQALGAEGISAANQKAADAQSKMGMIDAWTSLLQGSIKLYQQSQAGAV